MSNPAKRLETISPFERLLREGWQISQAPGVPFSQRMRNASAHMNAATTDGWADLNRQQHEYNIRREIHQQNEHNARLLAALGMLSNPPQAAPHEIHQSDSGSLDEFHPSDCECGECEPDEYKNAAENEVHPLGCRCGDCNTSSYHATSVPGSQSLAPSSEIQGQAHVGEGDSQIEKDQSVESASRLDGSDRWSAEDAAETEYGSFQDGGAEIDEERPVPFQNGSGRTRRGRSLVRRSDPASNINQPTPVNITKGISPEQQSTHDKTKAWVRHGHYRSSKPTISSERAQQKDFTADANDMQKAAPALSDKKAELPDSTDSIRPDASTPDLPRGLNQTLVNSIDLSSQVSPRQIDHPPTRVFSGASDGRQTSIVQSPSLPGHRRRRPASSEIPVQAGAAVPVPEQGSPELDMRHTHRYHNVKRGSRPGPWDRFRAEVSVRDNLLTRAIGLKKSSRRH